MKKTIEFNPKFKLGDIVYGIYRNKAVKAKITMIDYNTTESLLTGNIYEKISYSAVSLCKQSDERYRECNFDFTSNDTCWFKSKDDVIDYLKTQIDKITTDDYNQTFTANN